MAENKNVIYRCPVCFSRENDVVIRQYPDGLYHCVKCSYFGTEEDIRSAYADLKKKYTFLRKRVTVEDLENDN